MKQNSKKTLTPQTYSLDIHSHTQTLIHSHSAAYSRNCAFSSLFRIRFALHYAPESTREFEFIKVCLPTSRVGEGEGTAHPHTHITVRHSSHKQLSRNHNKFTSAAQMFDKKFCEKLSLISQHLNDFSATLGVGGERERGGGAQSWLF